MGPLPSADRSAELERLSIQALERALPSSRFVFRREPSPDAGVDGSLELLIEGQYTNIRAHLQLKATDTQRVGKDGSVGYQVDVSNLNYLLNSPSGLYFLYIAPREELRFVWARDEQNRLEHTNPDWLEQRSVTLRFHHVLTSAALDSIHIRIRREAQFLRRVHDTLGRATTNDAVVIGVNPQTLSTTDPEEIRRLLLTGGMVAVAGGLAGPVIELGKVLGSQARREPRICLVLAYAEIVLGRYQAARATIADALLQIDLLSDGDRRAVIQIRDACDHQTGRLTLAEYVQRQEAASRADTGAAAITHQLNAIRWDLLHEQDQVRREQLQQAFRSLIAKFLERPDTLRPSRLQARLDLLFLEAREAVFDVSYQMMLALLRLTMGRQPQLEHVVQLTAELGNRWNREMSEVLQEAQALKHPLLLADALCVRAVFLLAIVTSDRIISSACSDLQRTIDLSLEPATDDANQAAKLYLLTDNLEGEIRAKLLLADICELDGHPSGARDLAKEVLPKALAMDYARHAEHAEAHLRGQTPLSRIIASLEDLASRDHDLLWADLPDEQVPTMARDLLTALWLPIERLSTVEREVLSWRDIARERFGWCKHIELLQDLTHTKHPSTHFRRDPHRSCHCIKHGHRTRISDPRWPVVITAFKRAYCDCCPDREPKMRMC